MRNTLGLLKTLPDYPTRLHLLRTLRHSFMVRTASTPLCAHQTLRLAGARLSIGATKAMDGLAVTEMETRTKAVDRGDHPLNRTCRITTMRTGDRDRQAKNRMRCFAGWKEGREGGVKGGRSDQVSLLGICLRVILEGRGPGRPGWSKADITFTNRHMTSQAIVNSQSRLSCSESLARLFLSVATQAITCSAHVRAPMLSD